MDKFTITPDGINHLETPAFKASWFSGEINPPEQDTRESYYYAGSGGNDRILIYGIKWQDETPDQGHFNCLMDQAITALDHWIAERF